MERRTHPAEAVQRELHAPRLLLQQRGEAGQPGDEAEAHGREAALPAHERVAQAHRCTRGDHCAGCLPLRHTAVGAACLTHGMQRSDKVQGAETVCSLQLQRTPQKGKWNDKPPMRHSLFPPQRRWQRSWLFL
jgi:hypothetical protein